MSISYNKVILVGRTTRVPEMKMTTGMQKVVNFTLAVDREFGRDSETDFFNCVAFGKTAETIAAYVRKGDLILVEGRLEIDKWTDREGVNRERTKIVVSKFTFLETKKSREEREEDVGEVESLENIDELGDESLSILNLDEFLSILNIFEKLQEFKDE